MARNTNAKKLADISDADTALFWLERPAILWIFFSSGFEVVFPFLALLLCNLTYFLNFVERRTINPNHLTVSDHTSNSLYSFRIILRVIYFSFDLF